MDELLDLILAPLSGGLADQVRQRFEVTRTDPDVGEPHALQDALQDFPDEFPPEWWLDPARCRWWSALHVDWKAYDEVAWQVQAIARTLGLDDLFSSQEVSLLDLQFDHPELLTTPPSDTPTMDVLGEASEWLQERGYELLYLDTGGDEYLAFPVRLDLLARAQAALERLNVSTYLV